MPPAKQDIRDELPSNFAAMYEAHHGDNQRRFLKLEDKLDANTSMTRQLCEDTGDLLEMWKDAGVFFKWMRRLGTWLLWVGKVATATIAIFALWKLWPPK